MKYVIQVLNLDKRSLYEEGWIPAEESGFSPPLLERLAAVGAIEPRSGMLSPQDLGRVDTILRLRRTLGVNLPGAVIIAELMERLEEMEMGPGCRGGPDMTMFFG